MLRAFSTAATGMAAQQTQVDVIANNLANVNTTGFKKSQVDFSDQEGQLQPMGASCFQAPASLTPAPAQKATVRQGFQESSNVQMVEELVGMITVSRLYEANVRVLTANRDASKSLMDVAMG